MTNSEVREPFVQERAATAQADDANLEPAQNLLAHITEQPDMPIVHRIGMLRARRRARVKTIDLRADHRRIAEGNTPLRRPDVAGDGPLRKDQGSDRPALVISSSAG